MNLLLADYANRTLYVAMVVLTCAMLAFAVHVAFAAPRGRGEVSDDLADDLADVESGVDVDVAAARPELVTSGVAAVGAAASGAGIGRRIGVASGAVLHESGAMPPPAGARGARAGRFGMTLTWLAGFLLVMSVVLRGIAVGRVPVANMFEFAVFGATGVTLLYLGLAMRWSIRWLGLFVVTPVLLTLGLALAVWYSPAVELVPSLKSLWLIIHVPIAVLAVAMFTIAFAVLLVQLGQEQREAQLAAGGAPRGLAGKLSFFDALPGSRTLDRLAYSLHIVAFPLWTFSVIAGAIWAQQAWGSYWNWDPKETWTFVIWVIYAAYLHARATSGWSRRTANILACVGYAAIIVNFAVVNVFFVGQHSYSGL